MLDKSSCFITKLLANADRYMQVPYKDIFDILAMFDAWGNIPDSAWQEVERIYGKRIILLGLKQALTNVMADSDKYYDSAIKHLHIDPAMAEHLIYKVGPRFKHIVCGRSQ